MQCKHGIEICTTEILLANKADGHLVPQRLQGKHGIEMCTTESKVILPAVKTDGHGMAPCTSDSQRLHGKHGAKMSTTESKVLNLKIIN